MSRRNKLQKFAEVAGFTNVYENFYDPDAQLLHQGERIAMQGRWSVSHFKNDRPITLELACGKGEYTIGLAQIFPDQNFIGVDIKGARIWKGAKRALEYNVTNAAFLRTRIEHLQAFFAPEEISEIWIVFPDPFPRESKANRRLTSPAFIELYSRILTPGGIVHLKTDDDHLYEFTLEVVRADPRCKMVSQTPDVYSSALPHEALDIKTYYELKHLAEGRMIKYVSFRLGIDQ
jgi:tRNA (guanine-N7-)-methyltransferase